jgi:hypothetical protein
MPDPIAAFLTRPAPAAPPAASDDEAGAGDALASLDRDLNDPVYKFLTKTTAEQRHPIIAGIGRFGSGVATIPRTLIQEGINAGTEAAPMVRAGNYPAAFERIARPITRPMDALEQFIGGAPPGHLPEAELGTRSPEEAAADIAGIPYHDIKETAKRDPLEAAGQVTGLAASLFLPHALERLTAPGEHIPVRLGHVVPEDPLESLLRDERALPPGRDLPDIDVYPNELPPGPDQRLLPAHEPDRLEGMTTPTNELPPLGGTGGRELPPAGGGGGPFAPPPPPKSIQAIAPRVNEASRYRPVQPPDLDAFLGLDRAAPPAAATEPPTGTATTTTVTPPAPPPGPKGKAAPSPGDEIAQALGYRDEKMMRTNPRANELLDRLLAGETAPAAGSDADMAAQRAKIAEQDRQRAETRAAQEAARQRPTLPAPEAPPPAAASPEAPSTPGTDAEGDAMWGGVLEDARKQGFTGSEDELRATFNDRLRSARELQADMAHIARTQDPASARLFEEIAKRGGIRLDPNDPFHGEIESLWEGTESGQANQTTKGGRAFTRRLPAADLAGVRNVLRQGSGLRLDAMAEHLGQDPQWREQLAGRDPKALIQLIEEGVQRHRDAGGELSTGEALRAAGVRAGEPWWQDEGDASFEPPAEAKDPVEDLLDTGEAQPRLPGDVGEVRESEHATPQEEAPFALERQAADRGEVQPGLAETPAPEDRLAQLPAVQSHFGDTGVPFPVAERGAMDKANTEADLSKPTLQRVPLDKLVATQDAVDKAGVLAKLDEGPSELSRVPPGSVGRHNADTVNVVQGRDGQMYLAGGTHRAVAAWARGDQDIQAVVYPPKEGLKTNVKDFLTRQLGFSPDEVDAMGVDKALEIGNRVRMHPEGVQAGIAQERVQRPQAPSNPTPRPNLGETSPRVPADELATMLGIQDRRTALAKTRVPAGEVNVPRETSAPEGLKRVDRGPLEPPPAKRETPVTQSEAALAKAKMTEDARSRAKLLENPTPANLDTYTKLLGEAADRQAEREFRGGTSKDDTLKKNARTGEYLASGLGGLQKLYEQNPRLFWHVMGTSGAALVGAVLDKDPLAGAVKGALLAELARRAPAVLKGLKEMATEPGAKIGTQAIRAGKPALPELNTLEKFSQPFHALPELWKTIEPDLLEARRALTDPPPPGVKDAALWQRVTRNIWQKEAIASVDDYAKQAKDAGQPNTARYAQLYAEQLRGLPTMVERAASDVTSLSPKTVRKTLRAIETAIYTKLFAAAADTAVLTRAQVLAAYPQIGAKGVLSGLKEARTPAGKALANRELAMTPKPNALERRISNSTLRAFVGAITNPIDRAHRANRQATFLGALKVAREAGSDRETAAGWARDVTNQVHGVYGEIGDNPVIRQLGPMRMLTKYPSVMSQYMSDVARHPDPGVRRRGLGFALGVTGLAAATGIAFTNLFFPHLQAAGSVFVDTAKDAYQHARGTADHSLLEDVDPRRGGTMLSARYPAKLAKELGDFRQHGFGEHPQQTATGGPKAPHLGWEGFLSLLGLHSTRGTNEQQALDDAYGFVADAQRRRGIATRLSREDLARALAGGDPEAAASATRGLSPTQLRDFYRMRARGRYEQLLQRVPKPDRAEFERQFRDRLSGAQ